MHNSALEFFQWRNLNRITVDLSKSKITLFSTLQSKKVQLLKRDIDIVIDGVHL